MTTMKSVSRYFVEITIVEEQTNSKGVTAETDRRTSVNNNLRSIEDARAFALAVIDRFLPAPKEE